jgi:hypothetical protein
MQSLSQLQQLSTLIATANADISLLQQLQTGGLQNLEQLSYLNFPLLPPSMIHAHPSRQRSRPGAGTAAHSTAMRKLD